MEADNTHLSVDAEGHNPDSPCIQIISPALERLQIWAKFASLTGPPTPAATQTALVTTLRDQHVGSHTVALDALALLLVGSRHDNRSLIHSAIRSYHCALRLLQLAVIRWGNTGHCTLELAITPYLLFWCERFTPLFNNRNSSLMHLRSSALALGARSKVLLGPDSDQGDTNHITHLELLVLDDIYHYGTEYALYSRRHDTTIFRPEHNTFFSKMTKRSPQLTIATAQVPGILESIDAILSLEASSLARIFDAAFNARVARLLESLDKVTLSLTTWQNDWYANWSAPLSISPYEVMPASTFPSGNAELDQLSCAQFTNALSFYVYGHALAYVRCNIALLLLHWGSLKLGQACADFRTRASYVDNHTILGFADNICRAIMFLCWSNNGEYIGYLSCDGTLGVIHSFFVSTGEVDKVEWCEKMKDVIASRGIVVPLSW